MGSKGDVGTDEEGVCDMVLSVAAARGSGAWWNASHRWSKQARAEAVEASSSDIVVHRPIPEGVAVLRAGAGEWVVQGRAAERAVALSDLNDEGAQAEVCAGCAVSESTGPWRGPVPTTATRSRSAP